MCRDEVFRSRVRHGMVVISASQRQQYNEVGNGSDKRLTEVSGVGCISLRKVQSSGVLYRWSVVLLVPELASATMMMLRLTLW